MLAMAKKLWKEEDGLGTLEILLIVAVLVAIAIVFRKQIIGWVTQIFKETNEQIDNRGSLDINI
jgi:Flp pilus assembly pilin Flp